MSCFRLVVVLSFRLELVREVYIKALYACYEVYLERDLSSTFFKFHKCGLNFLKIPYLYDSSTLYKLTHNLLSSLYCVIL